MCPAPPCPFPASPPPSPLPKEADGGGNCPLHFPEYYSAHSRLQPAPLTLAGAQGLPKCPRDSTGKGRAQGLANLCQDPSSQACMGEGCLCLPHPPPQPTLRRPSRRPLQRRPLRPLTSHPPADLSTLQCRRGDCVSSVRPREGSGAQRGQDWAWWSSASGDTALARERF